MEWWNGRFYIYILLQTLHIPAFREQITVAHERPCYRPLETVLTQLFIASIAKLHSTNKLVRLQLLEEFILGIVLMCGLHYTPLGYLNWPIGTRVLSALRFLKLFRCSKDGSTERRLFVTHSLPMVGPDGSINLWYRTWAHCYSLGLTRWTQTWPKVVTLVGGQSSNTPCTIHLVGRVRATDAMACST